MNVYGRSPSRLVARRNDINPVRRAAHLCPVLSMGLNNCRVNWLANHVWRVNIRFFSHRSVGRGSKRQGKARARPTNGMPRRVGLAN